MLYPLMHAMVVRIGERPGRDGLHAGVSSFVLVEVFGLHEDLVALSGLMGLSARMPLALMS